MIQDPQSDTVQKGQQPANPEEAKLANVYKRLGLAAMNIVYDADVSKGIVTMLKTSGDPPQAVAQAAMGVLDRLKQGVKGIAPNNVYMVAPAVIVFVCELGNAAGLFKASPALVQQATVILQERLKGEAQGAPAGELEQPAAEPAPEQVEGAPASEQPQGLVQGAMGV